MKVNVTEQVRFMLVVIWVKFHWNWLKHIGARVISRKCPKGKILFLALISRSKVKQRSKSYDISGLPQWSSCPSLGKIRSALVEQYQIYCDFPRAILLNRLNFSNLLFCSPIAFQWMIDRRASRSISTRHDVWRRVVQDCAWSVQLNIKANGPL